MKSREDEEKQLLWLIQLSFACNCVLFAWTTSDDGAEKEEREKEEEMESCINLCIYNLHINIVRN